ncbi:DUF2076 domain-containing protein [Azospirillum doebereinerae]|uniref:DUF2076 domain-containing protein n=1 Tax=Azospirillum doebereinerae TaxID=92933 RepID=A0A433J8M4_9PROT|nr:DUF2076 domain-containing protein [Azospirillum doebereinerae]MCG5239907.1 DUF2076 domain-containing protein [Azospirillum doebereinerae]RUQ70672.1 DUF2076 domain-containing protein [Azospirillum doebereinerae]
MDQTERQIIDDLFAKLRQAEAQSGPRDPQAESHIHDQIARQPAAPYLMAQSIVMLEQALAASQSRNEELEQQIRQRPAAPASTGGGGIFGGLFGGSKPAAPAPMAPPMAPPRQAAGPWGHQQAQAPAYGDPRVAAYANPNQPRQGGGFMAGAMQTAMGVAGGMLLGSALSSAFSGGGEANAAEPPAPAPEPAPEPETSSWDDGGGDFGGDEDF